MHGVGPLSVEVRGYDCQCDNGIQNTSKSRGKLLDGATRMVVVPRACIEVVLLQLALPKRKLSARGIQVFN